MATQLPAGAVWADTGEAVRPDAAPEGQSTAQIDVTALAAAAARRARSALAVSLATRALLALLVLGYVCLLYTSPSPRDGLLSRMPSSA